jgi:hypothetical protein
MLTEANAQPGRMVVSNPTIDGCAASVYLLYWPHCSTTNFHNRPSESAPAMATERAAVKGKDMLYFTRTVTDAPDSPRVELEVSENAENVERLETQGFVRCSIDAFREAWRKKDAQAFERLRAAAVMAQPPRGIYG